MFFLDSKINNIMQSLKDITMGQTFHMSEKQIERLSKTIQLEREYKKQIYEIERLDINSSLYAFIVQDSLCFFHSIIYFFHYAIVQAICTKNSVV